MVFHIYILNTHLCTFWYKFSFLQGVQGKGDLGVRTDEGRGLGQSHFPDCLVQMEGGKGGGDIQKNASSLQTFLLTLSLSFSVATVGDGDGGRGSAVRGQAYRTSRKSRTQEM